MYKIIIADDHNLVVDGYRAMLSEQKDIKILKVVGDGLQLLNVLKRWHPDLVILDMEMPGGSGDLVLKSIQNDPQKPKVLVVSLNDEATTVHEIFRYGANGYLSKHCIKREFVEAIYTVIRDGYYLDPKLKRKIANLEKYAVQKNKSHPFSPMEFSIMERICKGQTHYQIAETLCISEHTVDFHRRNIYRKTGVSNIAELVRYAMKADLFDLK